MQAEIAGNASIRRRSATLPIRGAPEEAQPLSRTEVSGRTRASNRRKPRGASD